MNCDYCSKANATLICSHCYLGSWCSAECHAKDAREHEETLCFHPEDLDAESMRAESQLLGAENVRACIAGMLIGVPTFEEFEDQLAQEKRARADSSRLLPGQEEKLKELKKERKRRSRSRGREWKRKRDERRRRLRAYGEKMAKRGLEKKKRFLGEDYE